MQPCMNNWKATCPDYDLGVQVLEWFTGHEEQTGLRVVRIKNKFSSPPEDIVDGYIWSHLYICLCLLCCGWAAWALAKCVSRYRDLSISVIMTATSGLRIIGEIQVPWQSYSNPFSKRLENCSTPISMLCCICTVQYPKVSPIAYFFNSTDGFCAENVWFRFKTQNFMTSNWGWETSFAWVKRSMSGMNEGRREGERGRRS
jgi:hypothetical protein